MIRFLVVFFSILALMIFCAGNLIKRDKPAQAGSEGYPLTQVGGQSEQQIGSQVGQIIQSQKQVNSSSIQKAMTQYNKLSAEEARVILHKGTERPDGWGYKGEYTKTDAQGLYCCRQCNSPLYTSEHKFQSDCGWPAFDDEIKDSVRREADADGRRVEILCENCGGHLGHVFKGEGLTAKNVRHCVNSVSMKFYAKGTEPPKKIVLGEKKAEQKSVEKMKAEQMPKSQVPATQLPGEPKPTEQTPTVQESDLP